MASSNVPMDRTSFVLALGVRNDILFSVRDVDRHPAFLGTAALNIAFIDPESQSLLLRRALVPYDPPNALYQLTVSKGDTLLWETGPLQWSLTATASDGSESMLWTDLTYGTHGWCRVVPGPLPDPVLPTVLDPTEFRSDSIGSGISAVQWTWSTAIACAQQSGYPNPLQTVALTFANFVGTVTIAGSLLTQPSTADADWFTVSNETYTVPQTGVIGLNSTGNYLWLRIGLQTQMGAVSTISVTA